MRQTKINETLFQFTGQLTTFAELSAALQFIFSASIEDRDMGLGAPDRY